MVRSCVGSAFVVVLFAVLTGAQPAAAAPRDTVAGLRGVLHWRSIGPFRGGRTVAATGVPGRPHEFYIGAVNGGIFKTTDAGRTWAPVFDDQPSASIGAIAVAPSAPDTVYASSGEGRQRPDLAVGDGIYKSTDGGAHWAHLGLRDGQQIPKIAVDPRDANRLYVAVLGHPYGPNAERGVYRSTDGGATFERVLFTDENTGAFDVTIDPSDARTLYASLWSARQSPWETLAGGSFQRTPTGSGLYKSTDGGTTWTRLEGGLPTQAQGLGRISIAVAPGDVKRVYAFADLPNDRGGVFRSDDAGATWKPVNRTARIAQRGSDLATVGIDPRNADHVYVTNTSTYESTDGGKTFTALRGAPGGDDYQSIWINPDDPRIILLASDQGAVVTLNGGTTWSSWYNQPTAQFYHVITDDRFPYRVYGGQQESGSAGVLSRGNDGAITMRDWHPVGTEEYGYVAPDPRHPGIIFGGKVSRWDERTGQSREVGPVVGWRSNKQYRFKRTAPLAFSPADKRTLYLGANVVLATSDYGAHWHAISPDLARANPATTANLGVFAATAAAKKAHRGVVYALGLSPRDRNVLWAGTDDGLVWRTADGGKHWHDVTPPGVGSWAKISIIDASPFDAASAYVAVNRFRLDEQRPQLFRTHDGGRTWTRIDRGIESAPTNVVRADPVRRGLLYAGTERGVWVSFDDGATWSSLRLNLPATSVRDLVVHGDDVVIGTHGRGFWILDDIAPLRHIDALGAGSVALLAPARAWRVPRDANTDTPFPPDEPVAANPPSGTIFDYALRRGATRVTLTIADARGRTVRRFASDDTTGAVDPASLEVPAWWIAPPVRPDASAGAHRLVWDLRTAAPRTFAPGPTIAAIPHGTPLEPEGVTVPPGSYTVTLDADGVKRTRTFVVQQDPRANVAARDLQAQYELATAIAQRTDAAYAAAAHVRTRDAALAAALESANGRLAQLLGDVQSGDGAPTAVQRASFRERSSALDALLRRAARAQ
ncbi:MAG: glycosyl hydrolase repeat-containing protein [Candidatus Eremiobacteraeota bacterium]|nr:glycosyl hydrolase repeat-containing protein [Candidatus Eremiobacteraeota bacterium]